MLAFSCRRERQGCTKTANHGLFTGLALLGDRHPRATRAFTGWNVDLTFVSAGDQRDDTVKTVLGKPPLQVQVIDVIWHGRHRRVPGRLYRFFVRDIPR